MKIEEGKEYILDKGKRYAHVIKVIKIVDSQLVRYITTDDHSRPSIALASRLSLKE